MAELEHAFRFNDAVLRHLTVVKKKADAGPSSMMKTVEREEARKAKDFARADALRDQLAQIGWEVRDEAGGARLVRRR